jgi:hypothetical protein
MLIVMSVSGLVNVVKFLEETKFFENINFYGFETESCSENNFKYQPKKAHKIYFQCYPKNAISIKLKSI